MKKENQREKARDLEGKDKQRWGQRKDCQKIQRKQAKGIISRTLHLHHKMEEIWKQGIKPNKVANDNI